MWRSQCHIFVLSLLSQSDMFLTAAVDFDFAGIFEALLLALCVFSVHFPLQLYDANATLKCPILTFLNCNVFLYSKFQTSFYASYIFLCPAGPNLVSPNFSCVIVTGDFFPARSPHGVDEQIGGVYVYVYTCFVGHRPLLYGLTRLLSTCACD